MTELLKTAVRYGFAAYAIRKPFLKVPHLCLPSRAYLCKDSYQEAVINSVPVCLESFFQALSVFMWTYLPNIWASFVNRSFFPTSFFQPFEAKIPKVGLGLHRVLRKEQSQGAGVVQQAYRI